MYNERHVIDLKKVEAPKVVVHHYEPPPLPKRREHHRFLRNKWVIGSAVVLLLAGFYFFTHSNSQTAPSSPILAAQPTNAPAMNVDSSGIIAKVGNLMLLPQGEMPTIAQVKDLAPLKSQAFFTNAKLGDYVLIYAAAKRAILFRPSENKIIEVGPVTQ